MAKLGSDKQPAVVRVRTMPKGEHSDIDLLLRGPVGEPLAPHAAPRIGRNDYCPCGSGKKFKNCCATP
jgi:uncharacterized protein YecA (UPF0149 family)